MQVGIFKLNFCCLKIEIQNEYYLREISKHELLNKYLLSKVV